MYVRSELLQQVEQQVRAEFKDQILNFEWFYEDEYTLINVEIGQIALQIPLIHRIRQIVNAIIGHPDSSEYIVPINVWAIESIDATDGLFNLTYHGAGSNSFFVHYYAPERERSRPFKVSIPYRKMFNVVRTIKLDSPTQVWEGLIRPSRERYAKHDEIHSFSKAFLAAELRDFLLKHLDFIEHIAEVIEEPLQILEPVPMQPQSSNGTEPKPLPLNPQSRQSLSSLLPSSAQEQDKPRRKKGKAAREMALAVA